MKLVQPGTVSGELKAPASKSMLQRAILAAALADGRTVIHNISMCDDAESALRVARALGAATAIEEGSLVITGRVHERQHEFDCGESGLCLRLTAALASLDPTESLLKGRGTLQSRPMSVLENSLNAFGVHVDTTGGALPIRLRGPLQGAARTIDGSMSSQMISGLLMSLPLCEEDSELRLQDLNSRPYVAMTLLMLSRFGINIEAIEDLAHFRIPGRQRYKACEYTVEGDWSGAAFLLVAAALTGSITLRNLDAASLQADRAVLSALKLAGASVLVSGGAVSVRRETLNAFEFDANDCPDLFPPLSVLATGCNGRSVIRGADRLIHKESNRAATIVSELSKLGACISRQADAIIVDGSPLHGGEVESHQDHRVAMACAIAGLRALEPVAIGNPECVAKSFPDFFDRLDSVVTRGVRPRAL